MTRVEYLKPNDIRQFAIVDAAMNDLLTLALRSLAGYSAGPTSEGDKQTWDIVGPVCETRNSRKRPGTLFG